LVGSLVCGLVKLSGRDDEEGPRRWSDISNNPDDRRVVAWREERIRGTAGPSLPKYEDAVARYCSHRRVLDLGAANHSAATSSVAGSPTHELVARYAGEVVAVDIAAFHGTGHANCRYITANLLERDQWLAAEIDPVDVLFAGHVIEHLDAPGELFELADRALAPGGIVVVATPNPLWFPGLWARARHENVSVNADHVALFGAGEMAELGERHRFKMIEWRYVGLADMAKTLDPDLNVGRVIDWAYRYARRKNQAFAHNNLIAVLRRQDELAAADSGRDAPNR
jgi:SAM-dependent methyltransferase